MTAALFGNTAGLGGSSGGNKHLVEFRAGRMTLKGRMVHPDKRKGLLYVYQGEDSLMHFCWKDRTTGEVEDDLLIFPDDCEFARVNECTTGRVYVLKFKSSSTKKYFFWMQESKTDKDDEYCSRINEVLNNPPTSSGRGASSSGETGEIHNFLNNMSQQQLMQIFGGQFSGLSSILGNTGNNSSSSGNSSSRPSATGGSNNSSRGGSASRTTEAPTPRAPQRTRDAPAPTATPPNTANTTQPRTGERIYLSDLQRYFTALGNAPEGTGEGRVDLAAALASPEVISTASAPQHAPRLEPHLPPAPSAPAAPAAPAAPSSAVQDDVRTTLLSPQFAQAANQFSSALTSGQMGPVISQFGLEPEVATAASTGSMQAFFKALENTANSSGSSNKKEADDKKKDEKPKDDKGDKKDGDEMPLD